MVRRANERATPAISVAVVATVVQAEGVAIMAQAAVVDAVVRVVVAARVEAAAWLWVACAVVEAAVEAPIGATTSRFPFKLAIC